MNRRLLYTVPALFGVGFLLVGVVLAQTGGTGASTMLSTGYDLIWWTVDGGGGRVSGGGYTLQGGAGQPDAGVPLTGGGYSLTGGFWTGGGAATPTPTATTIYTPTPTATGPATATPTPTATATRPANVGVYMPLMLTN